MEDSNTYIGIDVAKNHLDVCILPLNKTKRFFYVEGGLLNLLLGDGVLI